ncbi:MAG TPA: YtcA family lipoprotein [Chthoniobacterales bacterium]|jgi:YtcA-like protein|nr:YtcA family lipoprotein [Chthoniobacterales bacterium]
MSDWKVPPKWCFLPLLLSGCTPAGVHAPSIDVFGSYFPAWLICLAVGVALTVFTNFAGRVLKIRPIRFLGPFLWVSLILIFSISVWFLFYAT